MINQTEFQKTMQERILDCFPAGSYALSALLRLVDVVETTDVETAAVECRSNPRMLVNPEFVERFAPTPEKLLMLVMHELHHVLLGHTRLFPCVTAVDNLVFDAVINALLCRMFPGPEHTGFFTDFYSQDAFPACLLRPAAGWSPGSQRPLPPALMRPEYAGLQDVYVALYSQTGASYHDLYDALRRLVSEEQARAVPLLGDHSGAQGSTGGHLPERAPVLFETVRQIVERWPQPPDPIAGRSLSNLLRDSALRPERKVTNRAMLRGLLRRVGGVERGGGRNRVLEPAQMTVDSPVPSFDRRAAVLRSLGANQLLYSGNVNVKRRRFAGEKVHVYLDVSGSIGDLKGALYGAVLDCREFIWPGIHLFSTEVADITFDELRRGICRTTGGTDIACVAAHMRGKKVRRAVLITDGFVGAPGLQDRETLAAAKLGVALTPNYCTRNDLEGVADCWIELRLGNQTLFSPRSFHDAARHCE